MHKKNYASGFLFYLPTQQILLQQRNDSPQWTLFGGESTSTDAPSFVFQKVIQETLGIKLPLKSIHSVYDYFHEDLSKNYFILYAETNKQKNYKARDGSNVAWFTFKQLYKLPVTEQTRQDIIVAQRVINAKSRELEGEEVLVNKG